MEEKKMQLMSETDMEVVCGGLIIAPTVIIGEFVMGVIAGLIGE